MDTIQQFIEKLEAEFEEVQPGTLKPETEFRKLDTWSSMHALIVLALVDTNYNVVLVGEDMRNCQTIQDVYDVVVSKQQ